MGSKNKIALNIASGFVVSLIGTLPLGTLNLIALQLYITQTPVSTVFFALGVITIEIIAIWLTLLGATWLLARKKLLLYLELFSIAFMLVFALYYFMANTEKPSLNSFKTIIGLHPYLLGIIANSLNFMQYPFWAGWNIYLINNNKLIPKKPQLYWYLAGAATGTFIGMMLFVLISNYLLIISKYQTAKWLNIVFGFLFLALALFQSYKLFKKGNTTITP